MQVIYEAGSGPRECSPCDPLCGDVRRCPSGTKCLSGGGHVCVCAYMREYVLAEMRSTVCVCVCACRPSVCMSVCCVYVWHICFPPVVSHSSHDVMAMWLQAEFGTEDNICIICREEMESGKRVPCGACLSCEWHVHIRIHTHAHIRTHTHIHFSPVRTPLAHTRPCRSRLPPAVPAVVVHSAADMPHVPR